MSTKPVTPAPPAQAPRPAQPSTPPPRPAGQPAQPNVNTMVRQAQQAYGPNPAARCDLLYGDTGTTKTSRLGDVAEYIWERYHKRSRLISADPGGWEPIAHLVRSPDNPDGIIDAFALVQHREKLYEAMQKLVLGFWPKDVLDAQSPLEPPSTNGLREVGAILIEGLTSWCDLLMRINLTDLQNIVVPRSETEKANKIQSGEYIRRFASQTDYGSVQEVIADFVRDAGMLPVIKTVWTALEQKGEDDMKKPVYGPDLIGRKATGKCGPWFGNMIHLDFIPVSGQINNPLNPSEKITISKPAPFMFLRNHIDPADPYKLPWPAKTRASKMFFKEIPDMMEPDMAKFYTQIDALLERAKASRQSSAGVRTATSIEAQKDEAERKMNLPKP